MNSPYKSEENPPQPHRGDTTNCRGTEVVEKKSILTAADKLAVLISCDGNAEIAQEIMTEALSALVNLQAEVKSLQSDAMTMTLRLMGEDDSTFAPETFEVMARWKPRAMKLMQTSASN